MILIKTNIGLPRHFVRILLFSCSMQITLSMTVTIVLTPLFRVQLDQGVDSHNGNTSLDGRFELLDLAHAGLERAGLDAVVYSALGQVQAVVLVVLLLCDLLLLVGRQGL